MNISIVASNINTSAMQNGNEDLEVAENESEDEKLEREHFNTVVSSFLHYEKYSNLRIDKSRRDFLALDARHRQRLPDFLDNLETQRYAVAKNFEFIKQIIDHTGMEFKPYFKRHPFFHSVQNYTKITSYIQDTVYDSIEDSVSVVFT